MKNGTMSKFRAIVALLLCFAISFSVVACSPQSSGNSKTTVIRIAVGDNAYGTDVLEDKASRFSSLHEEDSYAEGKTGVKIEIETVGTAITIDEGLLGEGYHIIATGDGYAPVAVSASNGWIASLNDVATTEIVADGKTIEDKIPENIRWNYYLNSVEGASIQSGYYGLPTAEAYGGLTYDKDLFDREGLYFANENATEPEVFESEILGSDYSFKFTEELNNRSVGPDGKPNTEDDGLPSSLYELIALCDYIKEEKGTFPFIMSGKMDFYLNYFTEALYVSLLGYENGRSLKDFKSDSVDVVVGYTDEPLFEGLPSVKKPITASVKVEEKSGFYMSHTVEKYYTFAFMQLMEENNWYHGDSNDPSVGATTAQLDFLFGLHESERRGAMLIENSYWNNESRIRENFSDYDLFYGDTHPNREVRWMSLPVNIMTSVDGTDRTVDTGINTESTKGEPITLYIPDGGYYCVNARFKNDTEIMSAIKDWFLFYYSDAELSSLTAKTGYNVMVEYDVKEADLKDSTSYVKSYAKLLENANKVYPYGASTVYKNKRAQLGKQGGSASYLFGGGELGTTDVREYLANNSVLQCFEEKIITFTDWNGYFGTSAEVPELFNNIKYQFKLLTKTY